MNLLSWSPDSRLSQLGVLILGLAAPHFKPKTPCVARHQHVLLTASRGSQRPIGQLPGAENRGMDVRSGYAAPTSLVKGAVRCLPRRKTPNEVHDPDLRLTAGLRRNER